MGDSMDKLEVPGGWAKLRDPDAVTERQRKPFVKAVGRASKISDADDGGISLLVEVQDALVLALVEEWSFDAPVTADGLEDLPHKAITALRVACQAFRDELLPDFGPNPDPGSPPVPSND